MATLSASLQKQLQAVFAALPNPVTLAVFTSGSEAASTCEMCDDTRALVEELASMGSGKVRVELYDVDHDAGETRIYGIDRVPAIAVLGGESGRRDFGIRFFGAPAGYEFGTLVEDIRMVSGGESGLSDGTVDALANLASPLHIRVFVTPTCPYCPRAVLLAHKMAIASDLVTADAIDATEFPDLADRYQVRGVPRTVINDSVHVEGAVPEAMLMAQLMPITVEPNQAPTA